MINPVGLNIATKQIEAVKQMDTPVNVNSLEQLDSSAVKVMHTKDDEGTVVLSSEKNKSASNKNKTSLGSKIKNVCIKIAKFFGVYKKKDAEAIQEPAPTPTPTDGNGSGDHSGPDDPYIPE